MAPSPYLLGTKGMIVGSDTLRRDVLSRLMYGTRYTLLFCGLAAVVHVLLGIALGMLAVWYHAVGRVVDLLVSVSSTIPSLLFALIPLRLINVRDDLQTSVIGFLIVPSLTDWAEAAIRSRSAVRIIRTVPLAAYAIGRGRLAVLWHHVRPKRDYAFVPAKAYRWIVGVHPAFPVSSCIPFPFFCSCHKPLFTYIGVDYTSSYTNIRERSVGIGQNTLLTGQ
jgi:ABC-type microcin C transport system permease subunit YejE